MAAAHARSHPYCEKHSGSLTLSVSPFSWTFLSAVAHAGRFPFVPISGRTFVRLFRGDITSVKYSQAIRGRSAEWSRNADDCGAEFRVREYDYARASSFQVLSAVTARARARECSSKYPKKFGHQGRAIINLRIRFRWILPREDIEALFGKRTARPAFIRLAGVSRGWNRLTFQREE